MSRPTRLIPLLLTIVLLAATVAESGGYSVTGKVTVGGSPASQATVTVRVGNHVRTSRTGDDGRYYIGGLREGTYSVRASKDGRQAEKTVTLQGNRTVDFQL